MTYGELLNLLKLFTKAELQQPIVIHQIDETHDNLVCSYLHKSYTPGIPIPLITLGCTRPEDPPKFGPLLNNNTP